MSYSNVDVMATAAGAWYAIIGYQGTYRAETDSL